MIYIGIDPGKRGGYAVILGNGKVDVSSWDDERFVFSMRLLRQDVEEPLSAIAAVEKVGAFSGQGVKSMFSFGHSLGFIEGVLSGLGIPYQLIPPVTWKRSFSLIGKDKKASIETCQKLFPELNLMATEKSRVPSDGMAESALLALYAKRNL